MRPRERRLEDVMGERKEEGNGGEVRAKADVREPAMEREGRGRMDPPYCSQRIVAMRAGFGSEELMGIQLKVSPEGRVRRGRESGGDSVRLRRREAKEEVWERVRLKDEKSIVGAQREAWGRRRRAEVEGEGNRRRVRRVRRQLVVRVGATFEGGTSNRGFSKVV